MGQRAGKIELAWLRLRDAAPWGYIALAVTLVGLIGGAAVSGLSGYQGRDGTFEKCWSYGGRSDDTVNC